MSDSDKPRINYSKAYLMSQLADYPQWPDEIPAHSGPSGIVFVHSDYVVRAGPEWDDAVIFDEPSADWKTFCRDELLFDQARAKALNEPSDNG